MELILWRHCDAESGTPDELRRLTPRGRAEAARMGRWLAARLTVDCRILVSPAVRAQQTAQALHRRFETVSDLASGASVDQVLRVADWPHGMTPTLIVGHEPTLGQTVSYLLSGSATDRPLAKGAVAWLVSGGREDGKAVLNIAADPSSLSS